MSLSEILPWLDSLVVPLLGYGLFVMRGIREELRKLNGRVIRIEQWSHDHDEADEKAFAQIRRDLDKIHIPRRR